MEIISIEGIVVGTTKYGENSKILNILTKDKGLIGVISKGSLKEKSKLRVVSNNFTYANFHIYYKEKKLSTLIGADVINYFMNIKSDIIKFSYMSYLADLTKNVYKENSASSIYDIFINALLKIEDNLDPKIITNIVEIKYLNYLGVGLCLNGCSVCGSTSVQTISLNKGGFVCSLHRTNEIIIDENTIKIFNLYNYIDISKISKLNINNNTVNIIDNFLKEYYREYTGLYLKSKSFLESIKNS